MPAHPLQAVELKATLLAHVGVSDAATYCIAKKKTSFEFLREKMHLRPRTNTISAVARIRNALAFATHRFFQVSGVGPCGSPRTPQCPHLGVTQCCFFFQENGFLYVHTPIITASDCEGAGEMFQVRAGARGEDRENVGDWVGCARGSPCS